MPILTFAIPTYNRAEKLQVCLMSILEEIIEAKAEINILVYDNCSTDETPTVLRKFKGIYPHIKVVSNSETCDAQENFQKCFSDTDTRWTWMMGDDDTITKGSLARVLRLIETEKYEFIHLAEVSRYAPSDTLAIAGTLMELSCGLGLIEMTGFISCNVVRTDKLKQAFSSPHMEIFNRCAFSQSLALFSALSKSPCAFVNMPAIELQDKDATVDTMARWKAANLNMRYNRIIEGLQALEKDGIIPAELPIAFFRYLGGTLFGKIAYNYWFEVYDTKELLDVEDWNRLVTLATYLEIEERELLIEGIRRYRYLLQDYAGIQQEHDALMIRIDRAFKEINPKRYSDTYI